MSAPTELLGEAFAWTLASQVLLGTVLGLRVAWLRLSRRVGIGDGGDRDLKRAIRVHGNWAEWVPPALICLLAADLRGASEAWIWGLGAALLVARLGHAAALTRHIRAGLLRSGGVTVTVLVIAAGAVLTLLGG